MTSGELPVQGFIEEKIWFENGPLTEIDDLKTDPSQKSEILHMDSKIKNFNVIFHIRSAGNKFTRK